MSYVRSLRLFTTLEKDVIEKKKADRKLVQEVVDNLKQKKDAVIQSTMTLMAEVEPREKQVRELSEEKQALLAKENLTDKERRWLLKLDKAISEQTNNVKMLYSYIPSQKRWLALILVTEQIKKYEQLIEKLDTEINASGHSCHGDVEMTEAIQKMSITLE